VGGATGADELEVEVDTRRPVEVAASTALTSVDDRAADGFDDLYREEWSPLLALGWSLTGSWSEAEELVQDAFADAYRRWDAVSALERPGAWVRRAVVNRAASHHRHRGVARRGLTRLGARAAVDADAAGSDRTGEGAIDQLGDPAFWAALRALPERQAAAVALHYLEDRSVVEIAEVLGCRPGTVKVHLHRGRLALARSLGATPELDPREDQP
jgi:RNA polymerase sigma-70 factor (ECF subfamily)